MLIEDYELEVFTPPCEPGAERYSAVAHVEEDLSEVLPLLNATLRGAVYHPKAQALTWKRDGHHIAFHADRVATSDVEDRDDAIRELDGLIELVNRTWSRRQEITPDYATHQRPTPLAIYALLPQTNCKQCGEPTCYTFALKLASSQRALEACPEVFEPEYVVARAALQELITDAPAIGG